MTKHQEYLSKRQLKRGTAGGFYLQASESLMSFLATSLAGILGSHKPAGLVF